MTNPVSDEKKRRESIIEQMTLQQSDLPSVGSVEGMTVGDVIRMLKENQ